MHPRLEAFAAAAAVLLTDRLTKWIIEDRLSSWDTIVVIPGFFNIIHTRNPGAAFSLLATADPGWRSMFLLALSFGAVILVSVLLWRGSQAGQALRLPLALILGGALGNTWDRLVYGEVIDFLELYWGRFRWPAFNLADAAITAGAILVALDLWRSRQAPGRT